MDREFINERITATKALIVAYEDALSTFATDGTIQSYTLDTGQSTQTVTRAQLSSLRTTLDSHYNRLATLEARLKGGSITGAPAW